jgi:hypothetical protein
MYECAVGANPFIADTAAESVRRIIQGEYPSLATHEARPSESLVRIVERAMSLDPEQRYPDLKALGRDLLQLAGERTRMTWRLSFGDSGGLSFGRGKPLSVLIALEQAFARAQDAWLRRFDWSTAAAILFGLVTFAWGIALLLGD